MLVLSRKLGESVYIGDDIVVTVAKIDRGKVRLGILAPRQVEVFRSELKDGERPIRTAWCDVPKEPQP